MAETTLATGTKMEKFIVLMPKDQEQKFEQAIAPTLFAAVKMFLAVGVIQDDLQKYLVAKLKETRRYNKKRAAKSLVEAVKALVLAVEAKESPMHFEKILVTNGKQKDDLMVMLPADPEGLRLVVVEFMKEFTSKTTLETPIQPNPVTTPGDAADAPTDKDVQVSKLIGNGEKGLVVDAGQGLQRVNEDPVPQESTRAPRIVRSSTGVGKAPEPTPAQAARVAAADPAIDIARTDPGIGMVPGDPIPAKPAPRADPNAITPSNGRSITLVVPVHKSFATPVEPSPDAVLQACKALEEKLGAFRKDPRLLLAKTQDEINALSLELEDVLDPKLRLEDSKDVADVALQQQLNCIGDLDYLKKMGTTSIVDLVQDVITALEKSRGYEAPKPVAPAPQPLLQPAPQSRAVTKDRLADVAMAALADPKTPVETLERLYNQAYLQNDLIVCLKVLEGNREVRRMYAPIFFDAMVDRFRMHPHHDESAGKELREAEACLCGVLKIPDWQAQRTYDFVADMLFEKHSLFHLGWLKEHGGISPEYLASYYQALKLGQEMLAAEEPAKVLARHLGRISVIMQKPVETTMMVDRRGVRVRVKIGDAWERFVKKFRNPRSWFA